MVERFRCLVPLVLVCLLLGGISVSHAAGAAKTLVYYVGEFGAGATPQEQEATKVLFERFEKQTGIKVELITSTWASGKLQTMAAAGTPPDVMRADSYAYEWVSRGLMRDLTPLIAKDKFDLSDFPLVARNCFMYNGKLHGIPFAISTIMLYYNKDLFDKAGVNYPPTDWDDKTWGWDKFLEVAKKLTKDTNGDKKIDQWGVGGTALASAYPWHFGYEQMNKQKTALALDTPGVKRALQYFADLIHKYKVQPSKAESEAMGLPTGGWETLLTGKTAMEVGGNWATSIYLEAPFRWGLAALPWNGVNRIIPAWADGFVITSTKNVEESWELVKFLSSPEAMEEYVINAMGMVPCRRSLSAKWLAKAMTLYSGADPKVIVDALGKTKEPVWEFIPDYPKIYDEWTRLTDMMLLGQIDADECLSQFTPWANKILAAKQDELKRRFEGR